MLLQRLLLQRPLPRRLLAPTLCLPPLARLLPRRLQALLLRRMPHRQPCHL